ncbi:helix-turn-helix domain-containing protein [Costertonia aggregata]|uniref:Helix-turn-helix transcriptional regulator n=1 Tax=Costertonia aggregata TaxID=343403 RepID=A0A7H9AT14_9FLAO|nr:AraC family transcriptional regulator [Costertonia aggregata]QLG46482.1 helix-turn-helix transcriptional regulator [Costertonia aggregata]
MKTIRVSSLPLKEVVTDIAKALNVPYQENCSIYGLRLPETVGEGTIKGIDFEDGLGLIEYDCTFNDDMVFEFSVNEVHPLKFLFCLEGSFKHKFEDNSKWHKIEQYKNAIVASSKFNGHVLRFKKNERTSLHSLEIARERFQKKMDCELKSLSEPLKGLLTDIEAEKMFFYDGYYSLELADLFRELNSFKKEDYLKKLFLEGMAYKVLSLQILQYQDDLKKDGKRSLLRQSELKQLQKAVAIIEERLSELPTIDKIASEVGLHPKKLQKGFQELFGSSVNTFIQNKRMEMAKTLLVNTNLSLAEISNAIGYKSTSYLTKVFSTAYGINPSSFRAKNNRDR